MRRSLFIAALVCGVFLMFHQELQSCGDKFLVIGRGIRYERMRAAAHPASILIYSSNPDAIKDLQKMLQMAGHKIKNTADETSLFASLNSARYDIVLVNLSDASGLESKIMATPSKPVVLPLFYQASGSVLDSNAAEYPCVLKYKDKNRNPVAVIDQVMDDKIKGKPLQCNWSK